LIRRFMIVFGLHSSCFDFITFYVLNIYFGLSNSAFQTGWFLESVITEILILFVVRTKKSVIKSKPGKLFLITALTALFITIYLPFSPFAALLGFSIEHARQIIAIGLILAVYLITADLLKIAFFRFYEKHAQRL
jgi:P-type Mg2+ transporter